jgi:hypothetical protein
MSTFDVYRSLTQLGQADAREDAPPRSDEALWEQATQVCPDLFPAGPPDAMTMVDLLGAYDDGRKANRISLHRLADLIRERGIPAHVDNSGGGEPVLYAGEPYMTMSGEQRYAIAAGPGMNVGDHAYAASYEFSAGPDDDGATRADNPKVASDPFVFQTHAEIADAIARLALAETDRNRQIAARLDVAVYDGWNAFWKAVAAALPEAAPSSDGLPVADDYEADRQRLLELVRAFVDANAPHAQIGPVRDQG